MFFYQFGGGGCLSTNTSSLPSLATFYHGNIAQLVEQLTFNQQVRGSSPRIPTIFLLGSRLTVGQQTLNLRIGVRVLAPEPFDTPHLV